jgi:4-amino-4-deoxy-L-arabinose transferase-like glycosyltransferase
VSSSVIDRPEVNLQELNEPVIIKLPKTKPVRNASRRVVSAALSIPVLGAAIALVVFVAIAVQRIPYPYELDWLESGMLEHVQRLVDGKPLYTQPSASFTQLPYAPLMFVVSALAAKVFGVHFSVLRGISFLSTLVTFGLIYWMVHRETKNKWAGFIAAGVYAGTYKLTGTWFDVGKSDSLFLFLTLAGIDKARTATTKRAAFIAAVVMTLAVMTKQTAIFAFAPIAFYLLLTRRQVGIVYLAGGLALGGGTTLILNILSHGWFDYFVWELLFQHSLIGTSKLDFFRVDMISLWPVIPITLAALPHLLSRHSRWATGFHACAAAGLIIGAWSSRLHSGGAFNVLMPAYAAAAICLGISLGALLNTPRRTVIALAAIALTTLQLWFLRYDMSNQLPSALDRRTGDNFISWLKTVNGDVFIYAHPAYATMARKANFATEGATEDVLRGKNRVAKFDFERSMANAIHEKRFAAIIIDGDQDTRGFPADWQSFYVRLPGSPLSNDNAWKPITLGTGHPDEVYVPVGSNSVHLPAPH